MIHILKSFAAKAWAAAMLLLVLAGVLVGSTRLLLPLVSEYRDRLAGDIGAALGVPVRIEELGARLAGLSPELRLTGVEVLDPEDGRVQLHFRELRLRLGVMESLAGGQPRIDQATLVGARLVLRRQADGQRLSIGLGEADGDAAATALPMTPFLGDGRLRLQDSELLWDDGRPGLPPLHIRQVQAELVNAGRRHQLRISGQIPGSGGSLEIRADLFGDPDRTADWHGRIHADIRALDLNPLLRDLLPGERDLQARADLMLWSRWEAGRPVSVTGRIGLAGLELDQRRLADYLGTALQWRRADGDQWRLALQGLEWRLGDRDSLPTDAALWHRQGPRGSQFQLGLQQLRLRDLTALAEPLALPADLRQTLQQLQASGTLRDLRALIEPPAGPAPLRWQLATALEQLAVQPWRGAPGVQGLDLRLILDQAHGHARLSSDDLLLTFPDLFRWPLAAERLQGMLQWRIDDQGLLIHSDELALDTADLSTRSRLRLRVPADGSTPFLDMQSDFGDGDGTATSRYLPVGIMSEELVEWLDRAIVSGRVPSGAFLFRGPLDGFPFYRRQGRFEVLFGAQDVILDYQDGWPRLEEVVAEVLFDNERLDIFLQEARLLASRVGATHAWLPDLDDARHVFLQGSVAGPFGDALRILRETPLAEHKARYVAGMQGKGNSEVRLDVAIPVKTGEAYRIDGRVLWDGKAALQLDDVDQTLDGLRGSLAFDDSGVFADAIRARLGDLPLRARVDTRPGGAGGGSTRIDVDLPLRVASLTELFPHPWWGMLSGEADAVLTLDIDHGGDERSLPLRYRLVSDLQGVAVDLPTPLGKPAGRARSLLFGGGLPVHDGDLLQVGYGGIKGSFRLHREPGGGLSSDAGVVHCDTASFPEIRRKGFVLGGRLGELDAAAWAEWLARHAPDQAPATDERRNPSRQVDLAIDRVDLPKGQLNDVLLGMVRTPNAWELDIRSRELEGEIRLPDGDRGKPLSVQLETLRLDPDQWEDGGQAADPANWPDPRGARGIYLDVENLYLGGRPFGRLSVKAVPVERGLRLEQLSLESPLLTLRGDGSWLGDGRRQQSSLNLEGGSADLGRALRELRFSTALGSSEMDFDTRLRWQGPILEPALERLSGDLRFHIGEGRILEVEPGVGRLFGLLNLGALNRRLSLDFTDLFREGFAFDSIDARFRIDDGNAVADRVEIVGPAADLSISGRTGLLSRDYDQLVTVTPELSATLPLAGALAGGPVVAAALLLAEQVMGEEVNKLIRYQYKVTGPWDEPRIERIQTRDGWSLSNLLRPAGEQAGSGEAEAEAPPPEEANPFLQQ